MKLITWFIISSVIPQAISGLPLLQRSGKKVDHGKHFHRNNSTGRHRMHVARQDHAHDTHHAHSMQHAHHGHQGHGPNQPVKPHSHSGHHNHGRLRPSIQNKQTKESKVTYDVPKNKHFHSAAETGAKTHTHGPGHHHEPDLGMDFGLASILEIKNELLLQAPDNTQLKYTKKTPKKIETTTPNPSNWNMKNTVQVSDTRSFDTIFRETVSNWKLPVKVKPLPTKTRTRNARTNQQNVIRYEDHGTKSISKRGIGRLGSSQPLKSAPNLSKTGFIENTLTVRVWNESKIGKDMKPSKTRIVDRKTATRTLQKLLPVTVSPRYTQGRLGRRITKQHTLSVNYATTSAPYKVPKTSRVEYTVKSKTTTAAPNVKPAEMVKLQGIHVMFSQAQQKKNNSVPTIHLTAAIDEQQNPKQKISHKIPSPLNSLQSVINKIVGTAIIKDGHLYLIVYPFGESKSMDIRYPQNKSIKIRPNIVTSPSPNKTQLPTNKPIPIPGSGSPSEPRSLRKPTSTPSPPLTALTSTLAMTTTSFSSMEMNHHHGHHMHTMDHSMMEHGDTQKVSTDGNNDPLTQVPRFMSPWKALNLSSIFPHPNNVSISDDEDTDVKVVPFVAQATDPFDKIKMILATLANKTDNATDPLPNVDGTIDPSTDASFNFEVNIKGEFSANTQEKRETTTQKDRTSEEITTEYVKPVDLPKFTVTKPSISNTIPTTKRQKIYSTLKPRTSHPTTEKTPEYSTASLKTSTPTSAITATSHWLKSVDGWATEQGTGVNGLATAARISGDLNRKVIKDSKASSTPTDGIPALGFGQTVTTSSQLGSSFNFNEVRQLHESENLMLTRPRFNFGNVIRTTIETPITATPYGQSLFSQHGMNTLSPLQDANQAFSMGDRESQSDTFKVVVHDKSLSNTVPSTIVSSKRVSGETSSNSKVLSDTLSTNKVTTKTLSANNVNIGTVSRDNVLSDTLSVKKASSDKISPNTVDSIITAKSDASNRVQQAIVSPSLSQTVAEKVAPQVGNNVDRTTFPSHHLDRGQTEQIISLADVLTDIRKIQLHNMQRFNIHNNNFNTMLLSNTEMTPSLRPPVMSDRAVFNNYPRIPTNPGTGFLNRPTARTLVGTNIGAWQRHENNRQKAMRDAIDAMLVLSVDDVVADHTNLHGALVLSQSRDTVSGSSSSSSSNK